jgi:hypothetical protein
MAFTLVQAGARLYPLNTDGSAGPALTLPAGITLATNRVPRFARFKGYIVVVNTPTRPLSVGVDGVVRPLTPNAPPIAVVLTATGSGVLTGNYLAEQTYVIKDLVGNDIAESDYSPVMAASVATTAQQLNHTYVVSTEAQVNTNRLYRTTANGSTYFPEFDVPDNTTTSITLNIADASLGLIAKPVRGAAPDLTLICEWGGRLWGVDRQDVDDLRFTEAGTMFAWGGLNSIPIPHLGEDRFGINALAPRQNVLIVGRRNNIVSIAGSSLADYRQIAVSEEVGFLSQESTLVYRDAVYFLWLDGVYRYDDTGLVCISDQGNVRSWFTSNSYFNRGLFSQAFAVFDPVGQTYRLFLASAGQLTTNRWVEFNLRTGKWYGPHKTDAFQPTCALAVRGTNDQPYPMVGSQEGVLSQDVSLRADWRFIPIAEDVTMCGHIAGNPDTEKFFGELSVFTAPEKAGTLRIDAVVGHIDEVVAPVSMTHDLTLPRERLERLGEGQLATLRFRNAELGQNVVLNGYSLPYHETGKR